jgi:hypothetical protein
MKNDISKLMEKVVKRIEGSTCLIRIGKSNEQIDLEHEDHVNEE